MCWVRTAGKGDADGPVGGAGDGGVPRQERRRRKRKGPGRQRRERESAAEGVTAARRGRSEWGGRGRLTWEEGLSPHHLAAVPSFCVLTVTSPQAQDRGRRTATQGNAAGHLPKGHRQPPVSSLGKTQMLNEAKQHIPERSGMHPWFSLQERLQAWGTVKRSDADKGEEVQRRQRLAQCGPSNLHQTVDDISEGEYLGIASPHSGSTKVGINGCIRGDQGTGVRVAGG